MHSGIATDDAMNLAMSEKAIPLYEAVKQFIKNEVEPITEEFYALGEGRADRWSYAPGQLELLESVKDKAKASRYSRTEEGMAGTAVARRDSLGLRNDRTRHCVIRREEHRVSCRPRR